MNLKSGALAGLAVGLWTMAPNTWAEEAPLSRDALFALEPTQEKTGDETQVPKDAPLPQSANDLFALEPEPAKGAGNPEAGAAPEDKAALFGDLPPIKDAEQQPVPSSQIKWRGFAQTELAYGYADPEHWSKVLGRLELGTQGRGSGSVRWKLSARLDYNAVYDLTDHYSNPVRNDQRLEIDLRENYMDFAAAGWDWRLGRQHIVWGEMVGLFFADVVSAKDLREFVLPDFQTMRIPQWAARAEYFSGDSHAEVIWIPFPSYDRIGKPGAEFYPYPPTPPGVNAVFASETKPGISLGNTNYGLRLSTLTEGWDLSAFYYRSTDSMATFYRDIVAGPTFVYHPRHDRIWQLGGTLGKDLGPFVLKGEVIYTDGRKYSVVDITDTDGVATQDTLDWVVGLDFSLGQDTRLNTQLFQRIYLDHDPDIIPEQHENGISLLLNRKFGRDWEAEVLWISSLNRTDWLLRPKVSWSFSPNWKLVMGVDVFHGPATGLFGQYDAKDRVYSELRLDF